MDKIAIKVEGLTKSYGRVQALRGIDLEVQRGEIFGFLGPNGAGKTTAIRCLLDAIRPNGGSIRVLGLDPQKMPVAVQGSIGYLPGELQLYENLTARGLFRYLNALRGGRAEWSYVEGLAERLGLDIGRRVKNLSSGNKQKVGVIQALMHRPELLILDEPTRGLDPLIQQEVLSIFRETRDEGATVFFSSHILSEVQAAAERVAIIRLGEIVEIAETSSLINRALNRVHIRFMRPVEGEALSEVPGVTVLSRTDGLAMVLQVEGEMDQLLKAVAAYPVSVFETERPSLEEVFLTYYESRPGEASIKPNGAPR